MTYPKLIKARIAPVRGKPATPKSWNISASCMNVGGDKRTLKKLAEEYLGL